MQLALMFVLCFSLGVEGNPPMQEPRCYSNYSHDFEMLKDIVDLKKSSEDVQNTLRQLEEKLARISDLVVKQDPIAFYAQLTTDKAGILDHQTLAFDKVMINLGNGYNGMSGVFSTPSAGLYIFHWTNTNADRSYMNTELIVKNQVYGKAMSDAMDHNDYAVASNLAIAQLEKGDQVWVRSGTWHSGKLRGDLYSTFSGYRIQ